MALMREMQVEKHVIENEMNSFHATGLHNVLASLIYGRKQINNEEGMHKRWHFPLVTIGILGLSHHQPSLDCNKGD